MKQFESIIVRKTVELDYTDAVNRMLEDEGEDIFINTQDLKDTLTEWFEDDFRENILIRNLKFTIKPKKEG